MNLTKSKAKSHLLETNIVLSPRLSDEVIDKIRSKFKKNYFGLPPYALQQTPECLAYQCRKAVEAIFDDDEDGADDIRQKIGISGENGDRTETGSRRNLNSSQENKSSNNITSQRKVASALLTMVSNPIMMKHFLYKGGFEAVLKLIGEGQPFFLALFHLDLTYFVYLFLFPFFVFAYSA
jgi:hypothetical protein